MTRTADRAGDMAARAKSIFILVSVSAALLAGAPRHADASGLPGGVSPDGILIAEAASGPEARGNAEGPAAHVEARISKLHKDLDITEAQEPQFKAFADVMRSNAQAMHALFQQRGQSTDNTAVAHLRWYAQLTAAHADALNKLIPVFDALYQTMSEKQKEAADRVFGEIGVRQRPHRAR